MYSIITSRPNRLSAYAFNPTAALGSGAFWQPVDGLLQPTQWLHVVGEYTTQSQPDNCNNAPTYPGSIDIWVNGVKWNHAYHDQTGCMSQYSVIPQANNSPLNIGTMAHDTHARPDHKPLHGNDRSDPAGSCADRCTF